MLKPMPGEHQITELLERVRSGDTTAEGPLYEIVMPHLRRLGQTLLAKERPNHTLQATELVNRMYLRLAGKELSLRDRSHFFAIAARAMRRDLIEYGRRRPDVPLVPLDGLPEFITAGRGNQEISAIFNELLNRMQSEEPLGCSIVEMKIFLGLTDEETAEALGLSLRSMQARWQDARIWLFEHAQAQSCRTKTQASS